MGDLVNFPAKTEPKMNGSAVDLRRVVQLVRRLVDLYGSDSPAVWEHFDKEMDHLVHGYDGYDAEDHPAGKLVTVMTNTVVGQCQFTVLIYKELLSKK